MVNETTAAVAAAAVSNVTANIGGGFSAPSGAADALPAFLPGAGHARIESGHDGKE